MRLVRKWLDLFTICIVVMETSSGCKDGARMRADIAYCEQCKQSCEPNSMKTCKVGALDTLCECWER